MRAATARLVRAVPFALAWLAGATTAVHAAPAAADAGAGSVAGAGVFDRRELIVPAPGAELVRIDNPLGRIEVRAWNRPGEIHIIAEKRAVSQAALERLRVHYTAWQNGEISVETRVELGGRERSLPLSGSRVDMIVEVPPELGIEAKTFGGDLPRRACAPAPASRRPAARLACRTCAAAWSRASSRGARPSPRSTATSIPTAWRGTWTCALSGEGAWTRAWSTAASAPRTSARRWCG